MNEPPAADSVAARLRALRRSLGLSQEQLARRLGVSFATVNRWESGRTQISARAAAALADLEAAAALHATTAAAGTGGALPVAQSSFIGRERELADLVPLLEQSRLLTLLGPGGAGKTRLAIEALRRSTAADNAAADRVVFVPLEQIGNPAVLHAAVAFHLGAPDRPGTPLIDSLRSALAQSPRLLLLDGAEHLAVQVASLVTDLLASVPDLRAVVTSRVLLGVPGEVCWTVPPLACPSVAAGAADVVASDAVRLFIARASERLPGFTAADVPPHAIAELCRRLDGLPLAIELIAGWVGTLSLSEILQQRAVLLGSARRIEDVLQASYDLLGAAEQRRLAMLSVFAGSFSVGDLAAVLGLDPAEAAATARLLVDSSWLLVTRGGEQNLFTMLETVRAFAARRLTGTSDGEAVRARHAGHFAALAAGSEDGLAGPDAAAWTSRLETAVADVYAALSWADEHAETETGHVDTGLEISAAMWRWWLATGQLGAGRRWLDRFTGRAESRQAGSRQAGSRQAGSRQAGSRQAGSRHDELAGRAFCAAAVLAAENGDYTAAVQHAERSLAILTPLRLTERMAFAATVLGSAQRYLGDHEGARRGFQTAMDLRAELGDRRGVSVAMNNLALLDLDDGNLHRAQRLFEDALAIKRELGEQRSIGIGLANLADAQIKSGQWDAAEQALNEAAGLMAGNPQLICTIRCNQGTVAAHRGDFGAAAGHYRAAIAAAQAAGHPHDVIEATIGLGRVCHQAGDHAEAVRQIEAASTLAAEIGNPQRIAAARAALAEIAGDSPARDRPRTAADSPARTSPARPPASLTSRQAEVLALLAAGLSNKQIAEQLVLSTATVERHLATIYRNLGLGGRVEAARFAIENGLAPTGLAPTGLAPTGLARMS